MNKNFIKLVSYLLERYDKIKVERHNYTTYEWSNGYKKGYNAAIEDIVHIAEELDIIRKET